jgi:hypothetical protein
MSSTRINLRDFLSLLVPKTPGIIMNMFFLIASWSVYENYNKAPFSIMDLFYDNRDGPRSRFAHILNFDASTCYVVVEKSHDRARKVH